MHRGTAPVTVAPEPAMTSPRRRAGYGPLRAITEACARLRTVNIQPKALPTDLTHIQTHTLYTLRGLCNGAI